jgi:hypothetical protein
LALFFAASNRKYFHIPFTNKHLTCFAYFNIGFVFSNVLFQFVSRPTRGNRHPATLPELSDFGIRASDFRPKVGKLALFGFVFTKSQIQLISYISLLYMSLHSFNSYQIGFVFSNSLAGETPDLL